MPGYQPRAGLFGTRGFDSRRLHLRPRGCRALARKATTQQERAAAKRREKLAEIQEQIADGSLVVRQMTPEERKRNQPRPRTRRRQR